MFGLEQFLRELKIEYCTQQHVTMSTNENESEHCAQDEEIVLVTHRNYNSWSNDISGFNGTTFM